MATTLGTVTAPIFARVGACDVVLGEVVVPVKLVNSKVKTPTPHEIVAVLRNVRF